MDEKAPRRLALEATGTPLPVDRAFVVQFRAQPDQSAEFFVGRVEHIASGVAGRFDSVEELIAFVRKALVPAVPAVEPTKGGEA